MVIRIPLAALPPARRGYDRLIVVGVAAGNDHGERCAILLDAHRYTRGLELLPPGTPTNVTEDAPDGAGALDVGALFDAEFGATTRSGPGAREARGRHAAEPAGTRHRAPADRGRPVHRCRRPTRWPTRVRRSRGRRRSTALAAAAPTPSPSWPGPPTRRCGPRRGASGSTDPMSTVADGAPLIDHDADRRPAARGSSTSSAPTARCPRCGSAATPTGCCRCRRTSATTAARCSSDLENFLLDLLEPLDRLRRACRCSTPTPPTSRPTDRRSPSRRSDVGAVYGATPHLRELRLRPVDDTHARADRPLRPAPRLRRAAVRAGARRTTAATHTPRSSTTNGWYQIFLEHETAARGGDGVQGQLDALRRWSTTSTTCTGHAQQQEAAELAIRTYISRSRPTAGRPRRRDHRRPARAWSAATTRGSRTRSPTWRRSARATSSAPAQAPRLYTGALRGGRHRDRRWACSSPPGDDDAAGRPGGLARGACATPSRVWDGGGDPPELRHVRSRCRCCTSCSSRRGLGRPRPGGRRVSRRGSPACATWSTPTAPPRSPRSSGCCGRRSASPSTGSTRG